MINWLLSNHRGVIRASRWIVIACALALLGIAGLPHNAVDRAIGIVGIVLVAGAFLAWLALAVAMVVRPRLVHDLQRKRADAAARRLEDAPGR